MGGVCRTAYRALFHHSTRLPKLLSTLLTLPAIFLLCFLLFSLLSSPVLALNVTSRPTAFLDSSGIAVNASSAYDDDTGSFANISVNQSANVTYTNFSQPDSHAILNLSLSFDIAATGFLDDTWALEYYNGSWVTLQSGLGNQSRTILSYPALGGPVGGWNWSFVTQNLSARVRTTVVGAPDNSTILLYELWANLTTDSTGPNITLLGPANDTNYTGVTLVNFSYNATDVSGLANCSLILNGTLNQTNSSPENGVPDTFSLSLANGVYEWRINCSDNASPSTSAVSATRTLRVDSAPPTLSLLSPLNTTLSSSRIVTFSYTFSDVSRLANCSLFLNSTLNQTRSGEDVNWPTGVGQFLVAVANGFWFWNVTCTDVNGYQGWSSTGNFTQSANEAPAITITGLPERVTPVQAGNVTVWCNATIDDPQGQLTIQEVTAYLHRSDWQYTHADESSGHYTKNGTSCASSGINSTAIAYHCSFSLPYYARSMNWTCTYEAEDDQGASNTGVGTFFLEPLYAFSLSPAAIAYGLVAAGNTSGQQSILVTNQGNAELDLGLDGYAVSDGDGLALVCDLGNTTIGNERYALTSGEAWSLMTALTDTTVQVDGFNLPPKNDSFSGQASIYWRVKLGVPAKGNCSGFVTFTGLQS